MINRVAKVAIKLNLNRTFDYEIPQELVGRVGVGSHVLVPFRNTQREGFVTELAGQSEFDKLRPIDKLISEDPLITAPIMNLAHWMAEYYMAPLESAVQTVLPGVVRNAKVGFKKMLYVRPTEKAEQPDAINSIRRKSPKQALALDILMTGDRILLRDLALAARTGTPTIRALEKKGFVEIASDTKPRDPLADANFLRSKTHELMEQQKSALQTVCKSIDTHDPSVVLLHGVTGSGKTEIYLQAIQHCLDKDMGAIVLVPEISLTPQTVERFRSRFEGGIAVLHSHLSDGERHDEWHRIRSGKAQIVVGARSALFAPVHKLGLIVVDEEHENSYNQSEQPRYNARDVAVMRGHMEKVAVVLGSATPSVESYYNALTGKYRLAEMPHRIDHRNMPHMQIVDMRMENDGEGKHHYLSRVLVDAVKQRIAQGEQTILFLNRRGYSTTLICSKCGYVAECEHCSISMTYHKRQNNLQCHLCGAVRRVPANCPNADCQDPEFRYSGTGTERIEEKVMKIFPKANVVRVDSDTMRRKDAYHRVLGDFRTGKIDILIGTQMIAKGLHFPNVTLVGVVNADVILHMPDFRAAERTFQLLTQVAGRAGRGDIKGEVIVQTRTPGNPAIQAARNAAYQDFCDQEIEFRKQLFMPPCSHLICITVLGEKESCVAAAIDEMHRLLDRASGKVFKITPPAAAPIARINAEYRYQMTIRTGAVLSTNSILNPIVSEFCKNKDIRVCVDVDASNLL